MRKLRKAIKIASDCWLKGFIANYNGELNLPKGFYCIVEGVFTHNGKSYSDTFYYTKEQFRRNFGTC